MQYVSLENKNTVHSACFLSPQIYNTHKRRDHTHTLLPNGIEGFYDIMSQVSYSLQYSQLNPNLQLPLNCISVWVSLNSGNSWYFR